MAKLDLTPLTLGPAAAAVRKQVTPGQWRHIVNTAHKQGYAVSSFLDPNIPAPLKERTPKYLSQQATSLVKTAYAPAYKELTQREQRVKALDDKRAADNAYYNNWLNSQHEALTTAAHASDQALESTVKTVQANTAAAYDQARTGAIQQLSQLPGTVSDFSGANALGQVDAHEGTGVGQVGATGQQALAGIATAQGMRELAGANNFATIAALEAKRVGDTWGANQDLASDRYKLDSGQASDTSKALQDITDQEVKKAQSNRDFNAVMQKLDLAQQTQADLNANRRSTARQHAATLNETIRHNQQMEQAKSEAKSTTDANSQADFEAKWGVSRDTFLGWTDAQRQQYLTRARERGVITGGGKGGSGSGDFTPTQVRAGTKDYRSALGWAKGKSPSPGEVQSLTEALMAPKRKAETIHDPKTGKIIYNSDGTPKKSGGGGYGLKDPLLAKAVAEAAIYGGVSAKLQKKIKDAYGIDIPLRPTGPSFKPKKGAPTFYDKTK